MTLKTLRDERDRLATVLRSGVDPIERKSAERLKAEVDRAEALSDMRRLTAAAKEAGLEQQRRLTVRQIFERWCSTQLQPRPRADGKRTGRKDGGEYVRQQFERHVFPMVGDTRQQRLRKADLLALLDAQTSTGKMRTANVLQADLKQMFDFALDRELIASNPLATVKKRQIGGASVERERTLDENEVSMLSQALREADMQPRSTTVWSILATGVRVGELMGAVWADTLPFEPKPRKARLDTLQAQAEADGVKLGIVNIAARTWHLQDTKNQRSHLVEVLRQATCRPATWGGSAPEQSHEGHHVTINARRRVGPRTICAEPLQRLWLD